MAATHVSKVVQFTRPRVVHIGRPWVVHTARPRPVQTTRPSLVQYSPDGDKQTGPFILISPTDQFYSPTCRTLIETRNALFLTLSDIVSLPDGGRPVANPSAKGMMDVFHAAVLRAKEKHPPVDFFPTPSGSTWGDVHIHFDNDHVANIRVKNASGTYDFSRMGMVNRTSGKPSKQWELLLAFRDGRGWLTWESSQAHRRNKKRKQLLAESLQRFFRIDGDPFVYDEDAKGWCALFHFD